MPLYGTGMSPQYLLNVRQTWCSLSKHIVLCILDEFDERLIGQQEEIEKLQWQVVHRCCYWLSHLRNIGMSTLIETTYFIGFKELYGEGNGEG